MANAGRPKARPRQQDHHYCVDHDRQTLQISDIIGLTIVAVGTSLPEVAASVMAALKGERDIAVGNVVGSCVFNILGVVGFGGLAAAFMPGASGLPVPAAVLNFDLWDMLAAFVACLPVFLSGREIARWQGVVFLGYYIAYTAYLVMQSQANDAGLCHSAYDRDPGRQFVPARAALT